MNQSDILSWDIFTLSHHIKKRQISPVEVIHLLLDRIYSKNKMINAYITIAEKEAIIAAEKAEQELIKGIWRGHLHGIPIGLKDNIYTKDLKTTMGSKIYRNHLPNYDATVVRKLKEAGAIIIGKLNTHEFAYGPTGDRSYFGEVKNPHDLKKISGGSSSGSGAAVAANLCYAALGTDTGGSIRIPSACCGVVGMKPTFGRISKYGVFPLSLTLDHVGPMTRTVRDNAILLGVLSGYDERDPYSLKQDREDFTLLLEKDIKGSVIGIPSSYYFEKIDSEIEKRIKEKVEVLNKIGAEVRLVALPHLNEMYEAHQIIVKCEAYANLKDKIESHSNDLDEEVKERLLAGSIPKAYEYLHALKVRDYAIQEFNKVLEQVDVLITPTIPILPIDLQQRYVYINGTREHIRNVITRFTSPTNLNGFPSLSVPCGLSDSGLPIGLQIIGRPLSESNMYRFGFVLESEHLSC